MGNEHMLWTHYVLDSAVGAFSLLVGFHSHDSSDLGTHPCFSDADVWAQSGKEMRM